MESYPLDILVATVLASAEVLSIRANAAIGDAVNHVEHVIEIDPRFLSPEFNGVTVDEPVGIDDDCSDCD